MRDCVVEPLLGLRDPLADLAEPALHECVELVEAPLERLCVADQVSLSTVSQHKGLTALHATESRGDQHEQYQLDERESPCNESDDPRGRGQVIWHGRRIA